MSPETEPAVYWCEAVAEGPVYSTGRIVTYVLGSWQTFSPVLALRWLRGEARRIADRLDPDPACSGWVTEAMRRPVVPVPDCPAELRVWAADMDDQRAARERIKAGEPLVVVVPDADCRYTLSIRPLRLPAPLRPAPLGGGGGRRRRRLRTWWHRPR
ncbi:hypothetical protein NX801_15265 [Streptomyces sp. LP05-1]|uniref:Uncharacterized protein n=1 Tax=Streptomyces pyxinae TaxID=2970734 RepID=A0ABT2CHW7_9ACTN|nr:hypothetical protein [Streptomyces sp. LP05-1]MCS0636996.1 hypothetical protein [Streptomyces sp. LP05-1]